MLFQMLVDYIEHKLYTSIEEVHEKIVVYHASEKLTDGEFMTLFNMLYPVEEVVCNESESHIMTLDLVAEDVEEIAHPMPSVALELIEKMVKANKLDHAEDKLNMYVSTGQLSSKQCESMFEEEVVEDTPVVEDVPTILPEIDETDDYGIAFLPLD